MVENLKHIGFTVLCVCIGYVIVKHMIYEWKKAKRSDQIITVNSYFNIKHAILCLDCNVLFSREHYRQCPRCAGKATFTLSYTFEKPPVWKHIEETKKELYND